MTDAPAAARMLQAEMMFAPNVPDYGEQNVSECSDLVLAIG
jgi:hypothetical protein